MAIETLSPTPMELAQHSYNEAQGNISRSTARLHALQGILLGKDCGDDFTLSDTLAIKRRLNSLTNTLSPHPLSFDTAAELLAREFSINIQGLEIIALERKCALLQTQRSPHETIEEVTRQMRLLQQKKEKMTQGYDAFRQKIGIDEDITQLPTQRLSQFDTPPLPPPSAFRPLQTLPGIAGVSGIFPGEADAVRRLRQQGLSQEQAERIVISR